MSIVLIVVGLIWLVYELIEEASWNTNAYDGKGYDVKKAFDDVCVKRISKVNLRGTIGAGSTGSSRYKLCRERK